MAGGVPSSDEASDKVEKQYAFGSKPSSWRVRGQPLPVTLDVYTSGGKPYK